MTAAGRQAPGRSALAAVLLSGLAPGAGHAYLRRPLRGLAFVALLAVTSLAWTAAVPRSYDATRLFALPPTLLLLALLVDSARLAREAPRPFPLAAWQRWWTYAAVVLATGFVAPWLLARALAAQAGIVVATDDDLQPGVLRDDWVLVSRRTGAGEMQRGDVAVIERHGLSPVLRRVAALPGESVAVRRGIVEVAGVPWSRDLASPWRPGDLSLSASTVADRELMALTDERRRGEAGTAFVPFASVLGRASWVLLPSDHDILRLGATP